jgi:hypothetical protein
MSDDYSDLSPRQKARLMEQNLEIHNQRRRELGLQRPAESLRTPWDRRPDAAPAPVFYHDDTGLVDPDSRPPSWDERRRAARYRDGPPPPPPLAARERQQMLQQLDRGELSAAPTQSEQPQRRRPPPRLVPQEVFEQMAHSPAAAYSPSPTPTQPRERERLSPSQKRRERRKKSRGVPYPLPQDQEPAWEPVEPTNPTATVSPTCDTKARLMVAGHEVVLVCLMTPWPHPNQPHLVRLEPTEDATDVFIGWFGPGE